MQFDDEGTIVKRVRWYFAAPGAKLFPGGTVFSSSNWGVLRGGQLGPGEVWSSPRPWSNGATPAGMDGQGQFCGKLAWFTDGVPAGTPPVTIIGGIPDCCRKPFYRGQIGGKGGLARQAPCYQPANTGAVFANFEGSGYQPPSSGGYSAAMWYTLPPIGGDAGYILVNWAGSGHTCLTATWYLFYPGLHNFASHLIGPQLVDVQNQIYEFMVDDPRWPSPDVRVFLRFTPLPVQGRIGGAGGLVSKTYNYVGRLGGKGGPSCMVKDHLMGDIGGKGGVASAVSLIYDGSLGGKGGVAGVAVSRNHGSLGGKGGLSSVVRLIYDGSLGGKGGVAAVVKQHHSGTIGGKGDVSGIVRVRVAVRIGGKGGLVSVPRLRVRSSIGGKGGLAAVVRVRYAGRVGGKGDVAAAPYNGIVTACCPSAATPLTLHVLNVGSGATATATYNSGAGGWIFTDPTSGLSQTLFCVNVPPNQWRCQHTPAGHCTVTFAVNSLTCHPFFLDVSTTYAGTLCVVPSGTYRFQFTA